MEVAERYLVGGQNRAKTAVLAGEELLQREAQGFRPPAAPQRI